MAAPTTFSTAASIVVRNEVALTTPYVFPPGCENVYELSTGIVYTHFRAEMRETFLYVDKLAKAWRSCQPAGLQEQYNTYYSGSNYRKAVCPQSWVAWEVGMASYTGENRDWVGPKTWNTAHCCKSGDRLHPDIWSLNYEKGLSGSVCASTVRDADGLPSGTTYLTEGVITVGMYMETTTYTNIYTGSDGKPTETNKYTTTYADFSIEWVTTSAGFQSGFAYYPPFSIEWVNEDNTALEPKWPTMTNNMLLPTWTPGLSISDTYDNRNTGPYEGPTYIRMNIAIPIIASLGFIILLVAFFIICTRWRRKRAAARDQRKKTWAAERARTAPGLPCLEMADLTDTGDTASLHQRIENVEVVEGEEEEEEAVKKVKRTNAIASWWAANRPGKPKMPREQVRELPLSPDVVRNHT